VTGLPGQTTVFTQNHGGTINDGMAVDECGNVYVADSGGVGAIVRIKPDGTQPTVVVHRQGETLHNFMWGRGFGGWEADKLYIVSLGVGLFEADVGVRGKAYGPTWLAP
jgi:sugar lactone lactonase YvrE